MEKKVMREVTEYYCDDCETEAFLPENLHYKCLKCDKDLCEKHIRFIPPLGNPICKDCKEEILKQSEISLPMGNPSLQITLKGVEYRKQLEKEFEQTEEGRNYLKKVRYYFEHW